MKAPQLFGTNGIRGVPNQDLTLELATGIGRAAGTFFKAQKIAMARDTRISGDMFLFAVASGAMSTGTDIVYIGELPTPGLQYYCKENHIPGIMITASHNPPQYNGIKAIDSDGTEIDEEKEVKIEEIYESRNYRMAEWQNIGNYSYDSTGIDLYINSIIESVHSKVIAESNLRVAIDTGNGASYYTSPEILTKLNCHPVSLNANPDGKFSSRNSEPKPENLSDLISIMKTGKFSIGIAHDGDADRCVFIDEKGNFVDGDRSLALIAKHTIKRGDTVVTPVSSSDALSEICSEKGAKLILTRVGAPIVARAMIDNRATMGGEENGGIIYGKHQYCRDGAMTMALMLDLLAREKKPLSELLKDIPEYYMIKTSVPRNREWNEIKELITKKFTGKMFDFTDGIKIYDADGWTLVRPSGTEKIIRVFSESKVQERAKEYNEEYVTFLKNL
ncbi:MAG: phosphoglucosamine mutase [Ferroplasma sp.]|uniref:phosphoglucosamine mutase n=1 Tax=Ferroplasma sp. TaxID=2591003 RepID=UPI002814DDC2|nr:phosphoglucosamine mutase [Ferroplasma sp.]WMT52132.1 MAG: phosphoglucosamine mutase [Ferroplasma sp.]